MPKQLSNACVLINTRPSHRSDAIRALNDRADIDAVVLDLPLLAIHDLPVSELMMDRLKAWQANHYDALVVTSVESARRALAALQMLSFKPEHISAPIIAVGDATAAVLERAGLTVILPKVANNEGMLELNEIKQLKAGDKLLIWRGVGGRRLLHDTLIARGVQIDATEWYERTAPADLVENFRHILPTLSHAITHNQPIFVLIASQMAYENWQSLAHPADANYQYLALGDRLVNIVLASEPTATVHNLVTLDADEIATYIS